MKIRSTCCSMATEQRPVRAARCLLLLWLAAGFALADNAPLPHTVEVDGHPLRVWEKAPVVPRSRMLLVHGRTWSSRPDFDLQVAGESLSLMDGLVERGVRTYAVDLRGYGESPRDAGGWLTPLRATDDVIGVLAWLAGQAPEQPKPYLFGWSYGALVAQLAVQARPDLVAGLILFGYPKRPGIDQDPAGADGPPPRQPTTAAAAGADFILPEAISAVAIDAFVAAALAADPVRADWRALAEWRWLDPSRVTVPTLLLEGFHDPLALDDEQAALFAALRTDDKAWVVIPGGAHAAFLEQPRGYFLTLLDTFMHRDGSAAGR